MVKHLMATENIPTHLGALTGKEAEFCDSLVSTWKNSAVFKEIEKILTSLEQGEDGPAAQENADNESLQGAEGMICGDILEWHVSEGAGGEPSRSAGLSPVNASTSISAARSQDCGTQTLCPGDSMAERPLQHSTDLLENNDRRLTLPSNAWPLLDIYFSYTHCWFPILEKHDILRTGFRYSEEDVQISPSFPESGEHSALWAALALSSFQEASITTQSATSITSQQEHPDNLYAIAKGLIPSESGVHEIGHVQALLILSLIKLGQRQWPTAWMLIGQATRIARYLGLDCPAAMQSKDTGVCKPGRSKHVFLGCFVLETLISIQINRIPSLCKENLAKLGSVNEDGLEEWHPWEDQTNTRPGRGSRNSFQRGPLRSLSNFNRLVSLMSVLNDLCVLKQNPTNPVPELELLARQLQLWVAALPNTSRVDLAAPAMPSPHIFGLEMAYEGVATSLSLEIAAHGGQGSTCQVTHQRRAIDSAKRLLRLLQAYMETYSVSTTSPTFGAILTFPFGARHGSHQNRQEATTELPLELEFDLKDRLQTLSSQIALVWTADERATTEPDTGTSNLTANRMASIEHNPMPENVHGDNSRPRLDTPALALNPPSMPPLGTSIHPTSVQYPPAYNPSMTLDPFADISGYGPRRPRIASDLDALFDELASLDGNEK